MVNIKKSPALSFTRSEAEEFLYRQAEYLDSRDYESWLNLFTSEATYWIPHRPGDTDPETQLSYMYDDVPLMVARFERLLADGTAGQQPATRCTHLISNVRVDAPAGSEEITVHSRFLVTQLRRDTAKYFSGSYTHHLVRTEAGMKIRLQRVDLIDCDGIHDHILQIYL